MDKVSDRERSGHQSRDDRKKQKDRDSSRDHDKDRDRDYKPRHHDSDHHGGEKRHDSKDYYHSDPSGGKRRHHRSRADSPSALEPKRCERSDRDSPGYLEPRQHEMSMERSTESVERGRSRVYQKDFSERHASSRKRKEHDGGSPEILDKSGKRSKGTDGAREERRDRRRFEDRVTEYGSASNGAQKEKSREERDRDEDVKSAKVKEEVLCDVNEQKARWRERRFADGVQEEEKKDGQDVKPSVAKHVKEKHVKEERSFKDNIKEEDVRDVVELNPVVYPEDSKSKVVSGQIENGGKKCMAGDKSGSKANVGAQELLTVASKVPKTSATSVHSLPTKVFSITTTNENEGVSIIRSDEVPGKSSTDGTTTTVSTEVGSLSDDALAKARKVLQMKKELSEKLKKIHVLSKLASTSSGSDPGGLQTGSSVSMPSASARSAQTVPNTQALLVGPAASERLSTPSGLGTLPVLPTLANYEAVKRAQELAAKMGFHQDPEFAPLINMFPAPAAAEVVIPQRPSKAPVLRLDAQGREIDEHGNVINKTNPTNLSTLKVNINKQKKEAFQILRPDLDAGVDSNPHFDEKMGFNRTKLLRPKRMTFQFVEEGKWSRQAEILKFKNQFGEAQAKELKMKQSQLAKAKLEPDINPNLIQVSDRAVKDRKEKEEIPELEWWDAALLPSGAYGDDYEGKLNMEKVTIYVEHPLPIEPPAESAPPPPQPLKLTKKEQKKLRTQRRLAKERDRQEMIRQGLLEPPKPKIKMSNLMKVLGSEATQDPTRLEMEIRSAAAEREQAHVDRNIARKLTPAERREKKERKLFEDSNTLETLVSVYKINDLSHPQTRFKVDVNAQENRLTGCAVITDNINIVVVEGVKKAIKRYGKLMLKRINWAAAVADEEEGADDLDKPANKCALVWQGSVAKPSFAKFLVNQCRSEAAARKIFADAGVPHYWDLAVNFPDEEL